MFSKLIPLHTGFQYSIVLVTSLVLQPTLHADRQLSVEGNVSIGVVVRIIVQVSVNAVDELQDNLRPKDKAVGGATEVEHTDLVSFPYSIPNLDGDLARRHFCHSHLNHAHGSDSGVGGFDHDNGARGHLADVALGQVGRRRVWPHAQRGRVVAAWDVLHGFNLAGYGAVPAMVARG